MTPLLATYQELPSELRRLVLLTAVYGEGIYLTTLKTLVKELGWKGEDGRVLYPRIDATLRDRLLGPGLWLDDRAGLRCHPELVEALTVEAREKRLLEPIIDAACRLVPYRLGAYGIVDDESQRRFMRDVRFAMLRNDPGQVFRLLGMDKPDYVQANPKFAVDLARIYGDRLAQTLPEIQFMALDPTLDEGDIQLRDLRELYARFEAFFGVMPDPGPVLANSLCQRRLMRGAFEAAKSLAPPGTILGAMAHGVAAFMSGDDATAIARFQEGVALLKKSERKRNIHIPGLAGICHLLALLREGSPAAMATLRTQLDAAQKPLYQDHFQRSFQVLEVTVAVIREGREFNSGHPFFVLIAVQNPWQELIQGLCLRWLGGQPTVERLRRLKEHQRSATQGGYLWYAREAALLLNAWGDETQYDVIDALDTRPLTNLRQPEATWERALRVLREIATPAAAGAGPVAKAVGESELSMAWELTVLKNGQVFFEPRERKRRGMGWTKGRVVAIKRLREELDRFTYLTPADRAICGCIRAEQVGWGWGSSRTEYLIEPLCALRAAVGHPYLQTLAGPVELVQEQPCLLVARTKDGIHITLHPPCERESKYAVSLEGSRLRFYEFTAQHQLAGNLLGKEGLRVPKAAETQVLETITALAPMITVHSEIGGEASGELAGEVVRVAADPRPRLQLHPLADGLRIACLVKPLGDKGPSAHPGEGAASIFSEIDGQRLHARRDLKAERAAVAHLFAACPHLDPEFWEWPLDEPDLALETLEALQELGEAVVLEWPQGKALRLAANPGLRGLAVKIGAQRDWFGVSGELTLDDGRVMDMARLLELLGSASSRFVKIGEDEYLALSQELRKRLETIRVLQDKGRVHPLAAGLLDEALDGLQVKTDRAWQAQLQRLTEAQDLVPEVPSTLRAELRDYQVEGFRWLGRLAHWGAGACLADDMGLGKTVQTLALLLTRAAEGPALVLAPTSVCSNWVEEAGRFAPTLKAHLFGSGDRAAFLGALGPFDLVICTYGLLWSESEALTQVQWRTIVADEAQAFKNAQTKRSKAVMDLHGDFRLITTGTPIENHLGELWNLFRFINPGLLGSQEQFNRRFAMPIELRQDKEAGRQLKRLIRPFILRRLKSEVLSELPERTEITLHVELSEAERLFYEALRRTAIERISQVGGQGPGDVRFQVLAEIMRLRRACCNPKLVMPESPIPSAKLQAFAEIVEELRENRHKALVFSQFVDHLTLVRAWLDAQGIAYQYLDGATPIKRRQEAVAAFQAGRGDFFLISLKAGGAGLNLTAADYVIHLDPWWNPAVEDQASDRAHRIGQLRPVTIYRLVARDTIEDRILDLHRHKRDLADSLLEGTEMSARLGVEEMMALLREAG
jgi:hypothetical protein